jgi:hypothetical protein
MKMMAWKTNVQNLAAPLRQRDFGLGVVNGVLFAGVDTLLDPSLVLVTLVGLWTGSPLVLGLVAPLAQAGWYLPQLWVSGWLQNKPTSLSIYRAMAVVRTLCLMSLAVMTVAVQDIGLKLLLFFLLLMANQLAAGFSGLSFMNVVAKVVPAGQRGLFFAWRLMLGGLLAVGMSVWVKHLMGPASSVDFPANFALMFVVAAVLGAVGMGAFAAVREPATEHLTPRASMRTQLGRATGFLRTDANFRRFMGLRLALVAASMGTPFFAVYAMRELHVSPSAVGTFLAANVAASLVAYVVWGQVSTRAGNRVVMRWGTTLGIIVLALVLLARPLSGLLGAPLLFTLLFVLVGVRDASINVASGPLLLDVAPVAWRPLYVGFSNTVVGVAVLLTTASGLVVATAGFQVLFVISLVSYVIATWQVSQYREQPQACSSTSLA